MTPFASEITVEPWSDRLTGITVTEIDTAEDHIPALCGLALREADDDEPTDYDGCEVVRELCEGWSPSAAATIDATYSTVQLNNRRAAIARFYKGN